MRIDKKLKNTEATAVELEMLVGVYTKAVKHIETHLNDLEDVILKIRKGERITDIYPHLIFATGSNGIPVIYDNYKKKIRIDYCRQCDAPMTNLKNNNAKKFCSQACRIDSYRNPTLLNGRLTEGERK